MHVVISEIIRLAPCKINLTLDVFPPRADGYHDLDSIVVKFTPCDQVSIQVGDSSHREWEFTCTDPTLPTDARNLAFLAALRYFGDDVKFTGKIQLVKNLPYQAGLGSASSDAAAVMLALNDIALHDRVSQNKSRGGSSTTDDVNTNVKPDGFTVKSEEDLLRIANTIGSDVSLFLIPGAIRMQGRGDIVSAIDPQLPILHGVIVRPRTGVPTPIAYRMLDDLPGRIPGTATEQLLSVLQSTPNDLEAIAATMGNDFEIPVLTAFPDVATAHRAVCEIGALRSLLCGSGSAIFGLARSSEHAAQMAQSLRATGQFAWVEVAESIP